MESITRQFIPNLFGPDADLDALPWKPFRDGIEIIELYAAANDGSAAALLRYVPGAQLPRHFHTGFEHIIVLRGSQQDEHGVAPAGSVLINVPGSSHQVSSIDGCVALVIWEKPVRFE